MTSKRRHILNSVGAVTSSTMIWLFFITVFIYISYIAVPPYFSYFMMKTEVEEEAKLAHQLSDEDLAANILSKAYLWGVPIRIDNIVVLRGYKSIDIKLDYYERVDLVPGYSRDFVFHIAVSEPIKETSGLLQ